jgi:Glyoxalase/Bleomycin resistance protein/Dioxygenase superfamily
MLGRYTTSPGAENDFTTAILPGSDSEPARANTRAHALSTDAPRDVFRIRLALGFLDGEPAMEVHHVTPVLNVSSIADSFTSFEALGWRRGFAWNEGGMIGNGPGVPAANEHGEAGFGSVRSGEAEIFLCRDGQGSRGTSMPKFPGDDATDGVWMSWWLASPADVDAMHAVAVEHGMAVTFPPTDEPWGVREFHLRHPDGHTFRVSTGLGAAE